MAQPRVSAEAFERLKKPAHCRSLELVRGTVIEIPVLGPDAGRLVANLAFAIHDFVEPRKLGHGRISTGYWLTPQYDTFRGPNISFVSHVRRRTETIYHGGVDQAPDLAVEVVSPSDTDREVADKVQQYLDAGVARVWVVRTELKTITVQRPGGDAHTYSVGDTLSSDDAGFSVEGFALPLVELFAN